MRIGHTCVREYGLVVDIRLVRLIERTLAYHRSSTSSASYPRCRSKYVVDCSLADRLLRGEKWAS